MAEDRTLLERIRGNAEWEGIKLAYGLGGSAVITALKALTDFARHSKIDWVGVGILFALCAILFSLLIGSLLNKRGGKRPPSAADEADALSTQEVLSPLQRDALQLASDLRGFLVELGPVPVVDRSRFGGDAVPYLVEIMEVGGAWSSQAQAKYELAFDGRVEELRRRFAAQGIPADKLSKQAGATPTEIRNQIKAFASTLWELAAKVGDVNDK
jgi:hypothetical protein